MGQKPSLQIEHRNAARVSHIYVDFRISPHCKTVKKSHMAKQLKKNRWSRVHKHFSFLQLAKPASVIQQVYLSFAFTCWDNQRQKYAQNNPHIGWQIGSLKCAEWCFFAAWARVLFHQVIFLLLSVSSNCDRPTRAALRCACVRPVSCAAVK